MRLPASPNLYHERQLWADGYDVVAGVDEAGRGALAGPLVAAAVTLPTDGRPRGQLSRALTTQSLHIHDSKLLAPQERERVCDLVQSLGVVTAVAEVDPEVIDEIGIAAANQIAMTLAIERLHPAPCAALVDAFYLPEVSILQRPLIKGDRRSLSIALASIIAKVHRDRIMANLDRQFPHFEFSTHKGYGTIRHRELIRERGPCPCHRFCFRPVADAVHNA
ncbi:MAG: ribonuclease HII [Chloroflexota bacterium]